MSRLGIVTGLPREAKILRGAALVRCEGPGPAAAGRAAAALIAAGADTLMSFGVAGALDPRLVPGDLVVATEVITPDGRHYPAEAQISGIRGAILTRDTPVADVEQKCRLFEQTGAIAVDMESAAVAACALAAGIPFMAVRAIADSARRTIPRAAIDALRPDGTTDYRALLARPGDWWGLLALGRDWRRAQRTLRDVALGGGLVL